MIPGERTVGPTRLTIQFGGRRPRELNGTPNRAGPFIGTHAALWHGAMTRFTSRCRQRRYERSK